MGKRNRNRKGYEFSRRTKHEVYRRDRHKRPEIPPEANMEVDHIVSIRQCREVGIPPFIASSIINAQLLTRKENRTKNGKDADPDFVIYLLSLATKLPLFD